ncbi:unnamed protein product [Pleuronectes platessa]|uniref:Uncharacterized protein n=1 Tax=Pleuronectes platessa TaxID=8262 RepID=A0A9N7Z9C8_PLEPL|nr:unnamed protein product [Pleuronectes platessa]
MDERGTPRIRKPPIRLGGETSQYSGARLGHKPTLHAEMSLCMILIRGAARRPESLPAAGPSRLDPASLQATGKQPPHPTPPHPSNRTMRACTRPPDYGICTCGNGGYGGRAAQAEEGAEELDCFRMHGCERTTPHPSAC